MIFCEHCFKDIEISSIISSVATDTVGNCPVCNSSSAHLYDTDKHSELTPYFEDLISIYSPASYLPDSYPRAERLSLIDDLNNRWGIFSDIPRVRIYEILTSICADQYEDMPELFDGMIGIPELYDQEYLKEHALLKNNNWSEFVEEIKTKNRYHSKLVNFDVLEKYCAKIKKTFKTEERFFRARISDRAGFEINKMSAPPVGASSEGRANAKGITCLYLANEVETALHEVRAGLFDYVSVAKFRLKQDISVVDLRFISQISPFSVPELLDYAINKQYLVKLDSEMSKSLRRSDSTLDYVPTQYIVDFIKSIEHDGQKDYSGIVYNSTTYPDGYNLAIFDPELFEGISVDVYDIEKLQYTSKKLS